MTVATRLMAVARGGGLFVIPSPPPPEAELRTLLSAPSGGLLGISKVTPAASYYNGAVYFGWISSDRKVKVSKYIIATEALETTILDTSSLEAHAAPSVIVRPDGRIRVIWALHASTSPKQRISTNAEDISSFGSVTLLDSQLGGTAYTYCSQVYLASEDRDYLFWRDVASGVGYLHYATSDDGGATWSAGTRLVKPTPASANYVYWRVGTNGTDRIDILTTHSNRTDSKPASVYHLYYTGGAWYTSAGVEITATKPFEASSGTLVAAHGSVGSCDPAGVAWDGAPSVAFAAYQSGSTSNDIYSARWRSGAWEKTLIANTGGIVGGNRFVGSAAVYEANPDVVFFPKKVGTKFEMHRAETTDDGDTWTVTQVTSGGVDTMLPSPVRDAAAGLRVLWSPGTWSSDSSFSLGLQGWG